MPSIEVNGVNIADEVAGKGPPLVWAGGDREAGTAFTYAYSGRFSRDYQVLTWDCRNNGASGFLISDSPDECQTDAADRKNILLIDPKWFALIMSRWGEWVATDRFYLANLADEEVGAITIPAIVVNGRGGAPPEHSARRLFDMLPNAAWVEYSHRLSED